MMDCSEDDREPWERAEEEEQEELVGFNSVAVDDAFWCPDGGNTADNDESTAVDEEPCGREVQLPLAPATPAPAEQQAETPRSSCRKRSYEGGDSGSPETIPGALIPAVSVLSLDPGTAGNPDADVTEPPKRIRLRKKTKVAPRLDQPQRFTMPEDYSEEFISKRVWGDMGGRAQYNYVYEKIRGFYIWQVHRKQMKSNAQRAAWDALRSTEKQKDCDLVSTREAGIARKNQSSQKVVG